MSSAFPTTGYLMPSQPHWVSRTQPTHSSVSHFLKAGGTEHQYSTSTTGLSQKAIVPRETENDTRDASDSDSKRK